MTDIQVPEEIIGRIQKLLNMHAKHPDTNEGAVALEKAQQLLQKHNLDVAAVERATGVKDGRREKSETAGGHYQYQRELWDAVAQLNFCQYWTQTWRDMSRGKKLPWDPTKRYGVLSKRHVVVGRIVNTTATRVMATYLEQAVERELRQRLGERGEVTTQLFSTWAVSFREGATDVLLDKIAKRQNAQLAKERAERMAQARPTEGMGQALTLSSYRKSEDDANIDFLHGEGTAARWAADRAERAAERAKADAEYTAWAKANPEEAKKRAEANEKYWRNRGAGSRGGRGDTKARDYSAYYKGQDAGADIGLDPQAGSTTHKRIGK